SWPTSTRTGDRPFGAGARRPISRQLERHVRAIASARARGRTDMALTRDFRETVMARVRADRRFREALLSEAIEAFLAGEAATGKSMLRDLVNATIGFEELARSTGLPSKSLHRMLAHRG